MSFRPSRMVRDSTDDIQDLARQIEDLRVEPGARTSASVKCPDEPVVTRKTSRARIPSPPPRPIKALGRRSPAGRGRTLNADPPPLKKGEKTSASQLTPFRRESAREILYESPRASTTIRPAPDRFTVEIIPESEHCTMWDPVDGGVLPWAGTILVRDTQPWFCARPGGPIQGVHISFHLVVPPPRNNAAASASDAHPDEWHVSYTGLRDVAQLSVERGIAIEKHIVAEESKEDWCTASVWHVPFWVPVPNDLFARAEYRAFVCKASVTVEDDYTPETVVQADDVPVGIDRLRTWQIFEGAHPPPPARG